MHFLVIVEILWQLFVSCLEDGNCCLISSRPTKNIFNSFYFASHINQCQVLQSRVPRHPTLISSAVRDFQYLIYVELKFDCDCPKMLAISPSYVRKICSIAVIITQSVLKWRDIMNLESIYQCCLLLGVRLFTEPRDTKKGTNQIGFFFNNNIER